MLKREITNNLLHWKNESEKNQKRKILMIEGARQVGKTFIVDKFGESEYKSYISINFQEQPDLMRIFSGNLDTETLLINIGLYLPKAKLIPGETLIFFDEIQECPEAVTSLKFWTKDHRYDVIASGSMLGVDYKRPGSYPVGSIEHLPMHSLNFREFLRAYDVKEEVIDIVKKCLDEKQPVPVAIHEKLMELLKFYLVLGGMPEVVDNFVNNKSMYDADRLQRDILKDYRYDIAHYANTDIKQKAEKCYFSIPDQLAKENHKFQYSIVEKNGNKRKFGSSVDWLESADIVNCVKNVSTISYPLQNFAIDGDYRMYPTDIGLLVGMFDFGMKMNLMETNVNTSLQKSGAKGGIYEALVADMLIKKGHKKLYYRKNSQSTFEIEFLIENSDGVIPIEVKAGNSRSRSLDNLLKKEEILFGYKLISGNVGVAGKKITLPLYMAAWL